MATPAGKGDKVTELDPVTGEEMDPARMQFPSDAGEDKVENAERSVDYDGRTSSGYVKSFVVHIQESDADLEDMHKANKVQVLQMAKQAGVHPKAEAKLIKTVEHDDGKNTTFTYKVDAVPAHGDPEPETTHTPRHSANQPDSD